jgi:hypothetical protein
MRRLYQSIFLVLIFFSPAAYPAKIDTPMSALHLYSACLDAQWNEYARGFCDGCIDAFYSSTKVWCVPSNVTHGEVKKYVRAVLIKKAPPISLSASDAVANAIQLGWPCL